MGISKFTVISGTSVGALNGALIAANDFDLARQIWENLDEGKVIRATWWRKVFVFFLVFFRTGFLSLLLVFSQAFFFWGMIGFLLLFPLTIYVDITGNVQAQDVFLRVLVWIRSVFLLTISIVSGKEIWRWNFRDAVLDLSSSLFIGSPYPLRKLLRKHIRLVHLSDSGTRVFATVSAFETFYDPYRPHYRETKSHATETTTISSDIPCYRFIPANPDAPGDYDRHLWLDPLDPEERTDWMPKAVEITALRNNQAVWETLLHSARLPLIFPRGWLRGKRVMDGGVTDKTPLLPAVQAACHLIIVVYLDANIKPNLADLQSSLTYRYQQQTLTQMSAEAACLIYRENLRIGGLRDGHFPVPPGPLQLRQEQLITVVPSRPLGSTLDFHGGIRTRDLIDLGYNDMKAAIEGHRVLSS